MRRTCGAAAAMVVIALAGVQTQAPLRREIRADHGVVAAGRSYAADAGARILSSGGNAIDAGVATVFAAAVVEISHFGMGGEVPIIIYSARDRRVVVINGQGSAPKAPRPRTFRVRRRRRPMVPAPRPFRR